MPVMSKKSSKRGTCSRKTTPPTVGHGSSVFGETTRTLLDVFLRHASESGVLPQDQIRSALNDVGLFPSKSQVYEVVYSACESAGRTPVDHISFGEFCVLVTELREHYKKGCSSPHPRSRLRRGPSLEEKRLKRRLSGVAANFKVFLGGSCNPTTWRHDVAIPYLKKQGITFYNPQVGDWREELIQIEDQAKQTADVLFFVIDNMTRSTASMVEASYLAGCGRQLILVIKPYSGAGAVVQGERITQVEYEDLDRSHTYLTDLVERQGIPVFDDIHVALKCTAKAVQQNLKVVDLTIADGAQPVKYAHVRVADKIIKLKDAFSAVDTLSSGKVNLNDLALAYRTVTNEELPGSALQSINEGKGNAYSFEDFCCLVSEFKYRRKQLWRRVLNSLSKAPSRFMSWIRGQPQNVHHTDATNDPRIRDVFLGGTCGVSTWRKDLAIPILWKHGLSYFDPQLPDWSKRHIPLEAAVKDSCRLLLYVITGDTRGMTTMLEVAHYIGLGCDVVLCIQNIAEGTCIEGEELTIDAVKDYNRARVYLADLANRDGIPIFNDVEEAVKCAIERVKK